MPIRKRDDEDPRRVTRGRALGATEGAIEESSIIRPLDLLRITADAPPSVRPYLRARAIEDEAAADA